MNPVFITETDQYLFAAGTHYEIYKKLGAHPCECEGEQGVYIAVYAPNASEVYAIGDFNGWREWENRLDKLGPGGIWAGFVKGAKEGDNYKFFINAADGRTL